MSRLKVSDMTPEQREARRAYSRKWRAKYPQRQYTACRNWIDNNPGKVQAYQERVRAKRTLQARARKYGMTTEQMDAFLSARSGLCEACGDAGDHVDHDHRTSVVRGLLCAACNRAIGMCKDDVSRIFNLAVYLEQTSLDRRIA